VAKNPRSHTAKFLGSLLSAGPFAERPRFDPKAAARKAIEAAKPTADGPARGARAKGKDNNQGKGTHKAESEAIPTAQAPWEIDGRKWHTRDRVARNGRSARWDGRILEHILDRALALGQDQFAPIDWSQRGYVRIDSLDKRPKSGLPFLHATTSAEWIITVRLFVPRNTFKEETLKAQLRLLPFHESPVPVLSDAPRLKLANNGMFQEITITGFALADFQTEGFDAFLKRAVAAFVRWGEAGTLKRASEL
jgi:excinuclease ABC subunit A